MPGNDLKLSLGNCLFWTVHLVIFFPVCHRLERTRGQEWGGWRVRLTAFAIAFLITTGLRIVLGALFLLLL